MRLFDAAASLWSPRPYRGIGCRHTGHHATRAAFAAIVAEYRFLTAFINFISCRRFRFRRRICAMNRSLPGAISKFPRDGHTRP